MNFKEKIEKEIKAQLKQDIFLRSTPSPEFGDYAIFLEEPNKKLKSSLIEKTEVKGNYLNIFINKKKFIEDALKLKQDYKTNLGNKKKLLIEHTSINPNAAPHVGRVRNAIMGDSLSRILKFQNYNVETHYYVNDVGKQISMLVLAAGDKKPRFNELLDLYIKINKELEKNPELEKKVFELLNKLEKGDVKVKNKFKAIVDICLKGQVKILSGLGIRYDFFDYESKYLWNKRINEILKKLERTGKVFTDEHGRKVVDLKQFSLPMENSVMVLTRNDGTSLYQLRDLAYTIEKMEKTKNNLIVLGEDQKLYFQQLKSTLSLIGEKAPEVVHYSFILLKEGKMSTRSGNLVLLEDFMNQSLEKAENELKKKGNYSEKLAKMIGYGAIKFQILKIAPEKNITFDWDHALSFEGETGPYVQYTHARICSILKKSKLSQKIDCNKFNNEEFQLIKKLSEFQEVIKESAIKYKPNLLCNYLIHFSQLFNNYYSKYDIKSSRERVFLASRIKQILSIGLALLGIEAPESM